MGKRVVALITDMNQPLGPRRGNAMEVIESLEVLAGRGPADLRELCLELAGWMFLLGRQRGIGRGREESGRGADCLRAREGKVPRNHRAAGRRCAVVDDPDRLAHARAHARRGQRRPGICRRDPMRTTWPACVVLGGGREKKEDNIDPAVGLIVHKKIGDVVAAGRDVVHAALQ